VQLGQRLDERELVGDADEVAVEPPVAQLQGRNTAGVEGQASLFSSQGVEASEVPIGLFRSVARRRPGDRGAQDVVGAA
jgi:hypothetical protein